MILTIQLRSISSLFYEKERELTAIISNLQYDEVKTDSALNSTINRIESRLMLEPGTIGEPKITGHRTEERNTPPNYRNLFGGPTNVTLVTVEFPCTGSRELFEYRGSGALSMGQIYIPAGNRILIEVMVSKLEKEEAINQAIEAIRTTKELIKMNNPEIENWSGSMKSNIKNAVENKRNELKKFYE